MLTAAEPCGDLLDGIAVPVTAKEGEAILPGQRSKKAVQGLGQLPCP